MSLVLLLAASEGHVRLNYIDGSDLAIRNAGTATGNGRASVAGGLRMVKTPTAAKLGLEQPSSYGTGQGVASGSSLPPPNRPACPAWTCQFEAVSFNRCMRWGEHVGHQWQRGGAGRDGDYNEPPVRRRPQWRLQDGLRVRRHDPERSVRGALQPWASAARQPTAARAGRR